MTIVMSVPPPATRAAAVQERHIARRYLASVNAMRLSPDERVARALKDGFDHLGHQLLVAQCMTKGFVPDRALIDELLGMEPAPRDDRINELVAQFRPRRRRYYTDV